MQNTHPQPSPNNHQNNHQRHELQQLQIHLKTLQQKCDLQSVPSFQKQKKIKLYRKENQQIKYSLAKQAHIDTSLLLNSKELSDANTKLQSAIRDISLKLEISLESNIAAPAARTAKPVSLVTIQHTTVTEQTEQVDLPSQGIIDQDIVLLMPFKGLKSLLLGENKIGDGGVVAITTHLLNINKLQLNSNCFTADALKHIGNLRLLKVLDIRNNKLGDTCMEYLSQLEQMSQLSVSKNLISDQGVKRISNLKSLAYLDLTTNMVSDVGVQCLLGLNKLTHLYLMSNRITSKSVYVLFDNLAILQVLDVRFNINDNTTKQELRRNKPAKVQLFC